jgi:hypothetical protein
MIAITTLARTIRGFPSKKPSREGTVIVSSPACLSQHHLLSSIFLAVIMRRLPIECEL